VPKSARPCYRHPLVQTEFGLPAKLLMPPPPSSGKCGWTIWTVRTVILVGYVSESGAEAERRLFPMSYNAARMMVRKAGRLVCIELRPHDLRRHAATFASRSGTPIEIVSKVIMRHAHLSTTQRYLGKVTEGEAMRWIENLYG
jgi:integrase/recombinase XerD